MTTENNTAQAPVERLVGQLRELLKKANPVSLELSSKGFEIWSDDHPIHKTSYVWCEGNEDAMLLVYRAVNALPALLDIAEAANLALDHMDGNDVPEWMRESYLALGAALSSLPNPKDDRAAASAAPRQSPCSTAAGES